MTSERDRIDLKRNTAIWLLAEIWIAASYLFQEPARDPYDAAERFVFMLAIAIVFPLVSAGFLIAWWPILLHKKRRREEGPGAATR